MKSIEFCGRSLETIRNFPAPVKRDAGHQLDRVQRGLNPLDWKPMPIIGKGVREIRLRDKGQYRVIYLATFETKVYVLHAFQKKITKNTQAGYLHCSACFEGRTLQEIIMTNDLEFESVWDALEEDPVRVQNLKLRSVLLMEITEKLRSLDLTQAKAAEILSINQPRVSALLQGKISKFRLDSLVDIAHRLGLNVSIRVAA